MSNQNYLLDALEWVLAWDIPDEVLAEGIKAQIGLIARIPAEDIGDFCLG